MEFPIRNKVKDEPIDETQSFISPAAPSEGLIEFFLDNEYKRDSSGYYSAKVKCLDEEDGEFKQFVPLNHVKPPLEGDFKNHCNKCDKQFDNLFAAQNHHVFTHPDPVFLNRVVPRAVTGITCTKRNYNWLDEPIQRKTPIRNKRESPNIIVIKDKKEYLKKLCTTSKLVEVTDNISGAPDAKGYTLESIKAHPQQGIKVVKKSEIQFDQLRTLAEKKLILSKRPEPRAGEAPPKKVNETNRQLMKIDIKSALRKQQQAENPDFLTTLRTAEKAVIKYLCRRCNLQMFDPYVFDLHMRQHSNATFVCPFCIKTFCTKIGIAKHIQTCKNSSKTKLVKIVRLSRNK